MKIGLDARVLMDKYYSGVSEYAANLLEALLVHDKDNQYRLFYNSFHDLSERFEGWQRPRVQIYKSSWPNKIFNYFFQKILAWPKLDQLIGGADIFWSPHFNFSSFSQAGISPKKIITVHDLSFLRYPEFFSGRKNLWHWALNIKKQLQSADYIIAVSDSTKHDLIDLLGLEEKKIKRIYSGNNIKKREVNDAEAEAFFNNLAGHLNGFQLEKSPYILYLGNIEPRKNIDGLIAAFNLLREEDALGAKRFSGLKLVLAGADGWKNKKIYRAWRKSPYRNDILFIGYVDKRGKDVLYSRARVFAYPSYYEGFGFPPLEAMTYGVPVVCSNVSSLPELVGDAAIMVNPLEVQEIAMALKLILSDEELRTELIQRGYQQAQRFSWDQTAKEYLEVFQEFYEIKK